MAGCGLFLYNLWVIWVLSLCRLPYLLFNNLLLQHGENMNTSPFVRLADLCVMFGMKRLNR